MNHALTKRVSPNRISLTTATHGAIKDFRQSAESIITRPTRIAEIVPLDTLVIGTHNAAGSGAGGVFFAAAHVAHRNMRYKKLPSYLPPPIPTLLPIHHTHAPWLALNDLHTIDDNAANCAEISLSHHPVVWRMPFPDSIQKKIVSVDNPKGVSTILT